MLVFWADDGLGGEGLYWWYNNENIIPTILKIVFDKFSLTLSFDRIKTLMFSGIVGNNYSKRHCELSDTVEFGCPDFCACKVLPYGSTCPCNMLSLLFLIGTGWLLWCSWAVHGIMKH